MMGGDGGKEVPRNKELERSSSALRRTTRWRRTVGKEGRGETELRRGRRGEGEGQSRDKG